MKKAFCSWSSGKDSTLAFYRASAQGFDVRYLFNMACEDSGRSHSHNISQELLDAQCGATGISLVQGKASWDTYEREFKKAVSGLREKDITHGIFGDIDLQPHRDWVERVCGEIGITPVLPLWKAERKSLMGEFIKAGFEARVVVTNAKWLGEEWLNRSIDENFVKDLSAVKGVDACGEGGEYHTFVTDGPVFKKRIGILNTKKVLQATKWGNYWFLNIEDYKIIDK